MTEQAASDQPLVTESAAETVEPGDVFAELGITADMAKAMIADFQQRQLTKHTEPLKQEWGDDYDSNMAVVKEMYASLPADERPPETAAGARYLFYLHQQANSAKPPTFVRGTSTGSQGTSRNQPLYTGSQLRDMSKADYNKIAKQVRDAANQGLVDWSS